MKTITKNPRTRKPRRSALPFVLIVLVLAAAGAGYYYWRNTTSAAAKSSGPDYQTTQVRRGDLSISTSGSGSLVAGQQSQLNFSASGTIAKITVQVGDQVKQGQVLAQLDNLSTLQDAVTSAQADLTSAQQALDTLKQNAPANVANAQLQISSAVKAVDTAKSGLIKPGMTRCDDATTQAYYAQYLQQKASLDRLGDGGGNQSYYLDTIVPAKNNVAKAWNNYIYCIGFYDYEVSGSQAKLDLANAQLQQAQTTLDTLQKNNGVNPTDLSTAENKVTSAQLALTQAQETLDGGTIKAPFDGTILAVNGQVGDNSSGSSASTGSSSGGSGLITIADLAHPRIQFSVDETDMGKVNMGEQARVTFDAIPNRTFTGKVVQINPTLQTVNNYQTLQGLIELDLSQGKNTPVMAAGMSASVELIQSEAKNVLIVPVTAVHDLGSGQFGVFVVNGGQPRLKVVEVGLMDSSNAEIKSGLQASDVVTTGIVGTK